MSLCIFMLGRTETHALLSVCGGKGTVKIADAHVEMLYESRLFSKWDQV